MKKAFRYIRLPYALSTILLLLLVLQVFQNKRLLSDLTGSDRLNIPELVVGKKIDTVTVRDLSNKEIDLSSINGKKHLVILFTTSCVYCEKDVDLWKNISKSNQNLDVLAVSTENDLSALAKYKQDHSLNFPVFSDKDSSLAKEVNLQVTPTKILFTSDWKILYVWSGYTNQASGNSDLGALLGFFNIPPQDVPNAPDAP